MKKLFIAAALLLSSSAIFAQTKFGIKAGVNLANMTAKTEGSSISYSPSSRTSFNVTAFADVKVNETFSFQPGISISDKGYKVDESYDVFGEEITVVGKTKLLYLEIPLNAVAKFDAGAGKFFLGAGPYVGLGLKGKDEYKSPDMDDEGNIVYTSEKRDVKFGDGEDDAKPLDFGVNFLTGYQLNNGLSLNLGYGLGLANASNVDGESYKNKVFSLSIGFLF